MKVLSGDGNVEAWRGTEKRKSCGEVKREGGKSQAVVHANDLNKYNIDSQWRILLFGINFWQPSHTPPFIPPSLHPRPTFIQPLQPFHPSPPHSTHTLPPTSPPFCTFVLCKWERGKGKKLRRSGEARRKECQEVRQTSAHAEKKGKAYTLHCMKNKLPWPTLCFAKAPPLLVRA